MEINSKHAIGEKVLYWNERKGGLDKVKVLQIKISNDGIYYDIIGQSYWRLRYKGWVAEDYLFKNHEDAIRFVDKNF